MKFLVAAVLLFQFSVFAQIGSKKSRNEFEKKFTEQAVFISECKKQNESQNQTNSVIKPKIIINGCEWSGDCPIKLPKPFYPENARRHKIFGAVFVEVFLDENGNAVYAKAKSGSKIFYKSAELAAYNSQFRQIIYCGKKILRKKIIIYNFIPD